MEYYKPTQIIASLGLQKSSPATNKREKSKAGQENLMKIFDSSQTQTQLESDMKSRKPNHEITVTATGQLSQLPDRCRIVITIESKKATAEDAKNSVTRRLDYVNQALHNHHVKDNDITIVKTLQREDGMFHYSAEVLAIFAQPEKCQDLCNMLVEKLDENVKVSVPHFFHSPQKTEDLRRQACLQAVSNAKQKASEIAAFLNASLGKPLNVQEESCLEWEGPDQVFHGPGIHLTFHQQFSQATINVTAKISATFELKSPKNSAGPLHNA